MNKFVHHGPKADDARSRTADPKAGKGSLRRFAGPVIIALLVAGVIAAHGLLVLLLRPH